MTNRKGNRAEVTRFARERTTLFDWVHPTNGDLNLKEGGAV